MVPKTLSPLAVHVVSHSHMSSQVPASRLVQEFYARLSRGVRPTGIPVRHWAASLDGSGVLVTPNQPPLADAKRNAVILLIDQPFFDAREKWKGYVERLVSSLDKERDLLLPVSICGDAHRIARSLNNINCIPVADPNNVAGDEHVFQALFTAILGLLPESVAQGRPIEATHTMDSDIVLPRVFLCHAKSDGDKLARQIRQYIYEETQLTCFFDTHDIPHGRAVRESIQTSISTSCLLVIWTDQLLESRWCQFEILEARKQQRPIVVLDALDQQSPRIFPFLGNMPVIRWRGHVGFVVSGLLQELIRTRHVRALFEVLRADDPNKPAFMLHPPDLVEASRVIAPSDARIKSSISPYQIVVYPDPPLPAEELTFLAEAFPSLALHSLSEWAALRAARALPERSDERSARPAPLSSLPIGLSISEADNWAAYGLISEHQDEFALDLSRQLILLGAKLLWGGDLRPAGLGVGLEKLVRAYHQADHAPQDHIACYLAWPVHRNVSAIDLQDRRAFADLICLPRPEVQDADQTALNAICFSMMRQKLAENCAARIVLGGKLKGYAGRYPGVVEEALETINQHRPLYLIGGFGGASRAIYDTISQVNGGTVLREAWDAYSKNPEIEPMQIQYRVLAKQLNLDLTVDFESVLDCFVNLGLNGLSKANRLTESENQRLAESRDIHEILALLVKGLSQVG
jgi:hypothetical protein